MYLCIRMLRIPNILDTLIEEYILGEKAKNVNLHNIDWFEGGLQLSDITTKNVGENDSDNKIKYIMVRLENWYRKNSHEGWKDTGYYVEHEFYMTRLYWVDDLTQSVWNVCIKFYKRDNIKRFTVIEENCVNRKPCK